MDINVNASRGLSKRQRKRLRSKQNKIKKENELKKSTKTKTDNEAKIKENEERLIGVMSRLWKEIKIVRKSSKFINSNNEKQLEYFRTERKYGDFMKEFPIVTRYAITEGKYHIRAFKNLLSAIKKQYKNMPPSEEREKGYMHDQWIRRRADYIKFLYIEFQPRRTRNFDQEKAIWEDAYETLKGETDDFKNKYEEVKQEIEENKKKFKSQNARELLQRLKGGEQKLNDEDTLQLLNKIQIIKTKKIHKKAMLLINKTIELVPNSSEGIGMGPEEEEVKIDKSKPTIHMIEHVDPDRIGEVPEQFLMTKNQYEKMHKA